MTAHCAFCEPKELKPRLIAEERGFLIVASKGQIVPGYTLVIPSRHASCFGDLTEEEIADAEEVLLRIRRACLAAYGRAPIVFEHGIAGQTVKHAHLHVVPADTDLRERIAADFPRRIRTATLRTLRDVYRREGAYLYYESAAGERFVYSMLPQAQYLRIVLAAAVGRPEAADWRNVDQQADERIAQKTRASMAAALRQED